MARKPVTDMSAWPSLTLEGSLIAPAMVAQISQPKEDGDTREGYGVRKGLTIRDEISTAFRVGQSHYDAFAKLDNPSLEATKRFVRDFLKETFGFDDLAPHAGAVAFVAGERAPVVVAPRSDDKLDRRSPTLSIERSLSPAFALQDYLNDHDNALWGLVTNGATIRLMRDNASLTRPAYIEADLAQIFANEDAASFAALWLLIHRSRFGVAGAPASDCALERWRDAGAREGEAARDRLADQVREALKILGSGFLEANPDLSSKLKSGELDLTEWFNELLRLVYRLIFLMVAEDRNLLHPEKAKPEARKLYADGYGFATLRAQCFRAATWDRHHDRYEGIKVVFRALTHGQDALALPALGGLFREDKLPHLETARLRNKAFMAALYHLSWLSEKAGMVPVNWRAMKTEELGSVYESLLELQPQLGNDGKTLVFASEAAEQKGNQRKTTGSYYTPDSLVQALLDTALDPVLDKIEAEAAEPAKALLKLAVIDPACGSGHFLLGAASRIAARLARIRAEGAPSLADFRHALRDVARNCIYGVDRNPMAVELTKVALWIETVDPGLPLGFFDAQIRCGDALLGVFDLKVLQEGIPDAAYKPLAGDDKDTAKYYLQTNRAATSGQGGFDFGAGQAAMPEIQPLALDFSAFHDLPEDSVDQITAKAARFKDLRKQSSFVRAKAAADLYIAAFLLPKIGGAPSGATARSIPTTEELWMALNQGKIRNAMLDAPKAARHARAFHWPLEFLDVMQRGGFDVVLGNPPWERIKLQEQEFFAARSPEIANAPNKAARDRLIKLLAAAPEGSAERGLHNNFTSAKRDAEAASEFVRLAMEDGGRFAMTGRGDVNTYALFAELFLTLASDRGRAGVIVPAGIATDATTAAFFGELISRGRLASLLSLENEEFVFPNVHHAFRFALLTLQASNSNARPEFVFFARQPGQLFDVDRRFSLSPADIVRINPNTKTAPVFRSRADAELATKIYGRVPVLIDESKGPNGNAWGMSFARLFDMSNDSNLFRTAKQLEEEGFAREGVDWTHDAEHFVPLYEAKMIHQFDHRWATFDASESRDATFDEKARANFEAEPRYWVPKNEVVGRLTEKGWSGGWLIGWRRISGIEKIRTVIASATPAVGMGDSIFLMLPTKEKSPNLSAALLGCLSSMTFDFTARTKMGGTNLNYFIMEQLPVLPPSAYSEYALAYITPRVLELTYTSHSMEQFARDLGYDGPPFVWDEDRRALLRADLDAFYAGAYRLTRDELRYILDPADVMGPDYPSETFRVLKDKENKQYGEYRTRRLVLAAWDRMEANGEFAAMGM
ncbi:N-6 DNA methylase [Rhodoblastus sp. 17X3]|uniref:Eco57I restriction-modification methylase domain-containing protein n=1 Tax=Rhodoblastus sp. 17X3 TaxID=3047026 RepID=UPI0024B751E5|nr:N-6 DNA methylase [Rhodoblastus sp. 17X3]MDI9847637.1 N-6 DNA methylase [Rhodoblastus sp. 17X3]